MAWFVHGIAVSLPRIGDKTTKVLPKGGRSKNDAKMNKNKLIVMLKYRIERYHAMGNGVKCQTLISELNKLQGNKGSMENRLPN